MDDDREELLRRTLENQTRLLEEVERLRGERDESRNAARDCYANLVESNWTNAQRCLADWPWLAGGGRGGMSDDVIQKMQDELLASENPVYAKMREQEAEIERLRDQAQHDAVQMTGLQAEIERLRADVLAEQVSHNNTSKMLNKYRMEDRQQPAECRRLLREALKRIKRIARGDWHESLADRCSVVIRECEEAEAAGGGDGTTI